MYIYIYIYVYVYRERERGYICICVFLAPGLERARLHLELDQGGAALAEGAS